MNNNLDEIVRSRLMSVFLEIERQSDCAQYYPENQLSFQDEMNQIREYIVDADEYGIAYESLVVNLERVPFVLSGTTAVKLLEVSLIMRYKTERIEDRLFDTRDEILPDHRTIDKAP